MLQWIQRFLSRLIAFAPKGSNDPEVRRDLPAEAVRAASVVHVAYQLDEMRYFDVVDKIAAAFVQGMLPIRKGAAGRALLAYAESREERLSGRERRDLYARVLGLGESVTPNRAFQTLWSRFVSSVVALARETGQSPSTGVSQEGVRDAARGLAGNVSKSSTGGSIDEARRLSGQIQAAATILSDHEVLKAYGAGDMWRVIERVAEKELGVAVDTARHRELASAGADILGWLAQHTDALDGDGEVLSVAMLKQGPAPCVVWIQSNRTDGDLVAACAVVADTA